MANLVFQVLFEASYGNKDDSNKQYTYVKSHVPKDPYSISKNNHTHVGVIPLNLTVTVTQATYPMVRNIYSWQCEMIISSICRKNRLTPCQMTKVAYNSERSMLVYARTWGIRHCQVSLSSQVSVG